MEITTITPGKPGSNSLTGDCMDPSTETVIPSQSPTIRCDPVDTTSGRPEEPARTPFDSFRSHHTEGINQANGHVSCFASNPVPIDT